MKRKIVTSAYSFAAVVALIRDTNIVNIWREEIGTGYIDIFRFNHDGLIIEHWDVVETQTGKSKNKNSVFSYPKVP
ncbi:hypothetical protein [Vibrio aquimaris]|uniref:SnoaL-like domain protein n=1 Tax=Vibrio aquimaris TaxID=2587862 RepID=A0A5P9CP69_9VIBR|nr:hypothetical protein [Vibrio aquimaris]QFT28058.1 hypothetical protein FIV01_16840 [Vibrio aquimaris]